jgi:hypothetical protein
MYAPPIHSERHSQTQNVNPRTWREGSVGLCPSTGSILLGGYGEWIIEMLLSLARTQTGWMMEVSLGHYSSISSFLMANMASWFLNTLQTTSVYILLNGTESGRIGQPAEYISPMESSKAMRISQNVNNIRHMLNLALKTVVIFSLILTFMIWGLENAYPK